MMFDHELKRLVDLSELLDEPTLTEPQRAFDATATATAHAGPDDSELAVASDDDVVLLAASP